MSSPAVPSIPKSHHFIPQMHSRRFTDPKGGFWLHNKRAGKTYYSNPKQAFCETHLYTKESAQGAKDTSLETQFSGIEGTANTIIGRIVDAVRAEKAPALSPEELSDWATYFYMLWKRTPDALARVATLQQADSRLTELLEQLAARGPEAVAEVAKLDTPEERRRLIQGGKVGAIEQVPGDVLAVFASRGARILHITDPALQLVIGSLPVVRKQGSLHAADAEIWLPVAPDVAVGGSPGCIEVNQVDDPASVMAINRVMARQSTSFASPSKALVEELTAFLATLAPRSTPIPSI